MGVWFGVADDPVRLTLDESENPMSFSGLTSQIRPSGQRSGRRGARVDHILLHHQAGTNDDSVIAAMVKATKEVSANYTVSNEGRITGVVDEEDRAWTSGSTTDGGAGAAWDRRSITMEIENEVAGGGWPVSAAAHEAVARLVADISARYGIPLDRSAVIGHRELWTQYHASYATACPGGLNLDGIVNRARELLGQPVLPVLAGAGAPAGFARVAGFAGIAGVAINFGFGLTAAAQLAAQQALAAAGLYSGVQDGGFGSLSVKAFQRYLKGIGLLPPDYVADGTPGVLYGKAVQTLAARFGYTGPIDGAPGKNTSIAIVTWAASVIAPPDDKDRIFVRRVAAYLNGRNLGRRTTSDVDGIRIDPGEVKSNYWWLIQTSGNIDGLYPVPEFVIDGVPGEKSRALEGHYGQIAP